MNRGKIEFPLAVLEFAPGDIISGTVSWSISQRPDAGMVNLFWYADQRGGPHIYPVKSAALSVLEDTGEFSFSFEAPIGPFSYQGSLYSIEWAVELLLEPELLDVRQKITLSPTRKEYSFPERKGK